MMRTTHKQDKEFVSAIISAHLLEEAIEWIANNLSPEDVFSVEQLSDWATDNGFIN